MANIQFYTDLAPNVAIATGIFAAWELTKRIFKFVKIKDVRINIQLPQLLKFSNLEMYLTREKTHFSASCLNF